VVVDFVPGARKGRREITDPEGLKMPDFEGEDGKAGKEGVRSTFPDAGGWLSMDDSVFERLSIRFASFEGDGDGGGEPEGVMESKIRERSRAGFGGFAGESD